MNDRVLELAQKRVEVLNQANIDIAKIQEEMSAEFLKMNFGVEEKVRKPRKTSENGEKSLKEVVKDILNKDKGRGLELKEIVAEVNRMIEVGTYTSKAKKIAAIVSQAVVQLKKDNSIKRDSESKKYHLVSSC